MDTSVLNVVIGLILIYLLYSLLATALQEALSALFQRRANTLYKGIKSMLTNTEPKKAAFIELVEFIVDMWLKLWYWVLSWLLYTSEEKTSLYEKFYDHPIIKNYSQNIIFNKPSYLTSENFSTILIETLKNLDTSNEFDTVNFNMIRDAVDKYKNIPQRQQTINPNAIIDYDTYKILNYHLNEAAGDLDVFKYRIEKWFNDTMDRVSGWYKRSTQLWLFVLGISLSIAFNVDTIEITNYLSVNKEAAEKLADVGVALAGNTKDSNADKRLQEITDTLKIHLNEVNTTIGLGYGDYGQTNTEFISSVLQDSDFSREYKKDFADAKKIYDSTLKAKDSILNDTIQIDTALKSKIEQQHSNLKNNEADIIHQIQLSQFYKAEGSTLKRKYILYNLENHPKKWIGFFLTAVALSLGAPFWFDLLNKFVSLRTAVKTVDSSGSTTKNNSSDDNDIDG